MTTKTLTYIGSYHGTSKKGNDFTLSHFFGEASENAKGITGMAPYDFFPDKSLEARVLALKPLQKVNVDYVFAGGNYIMIDFKTV